MGDCGGDCFADIDADGVCDDVDDCVGQFDECGICNGGGIPTGSCNCDGDVLDDCGICGGDGTSCVGCTYELACNYDSEATISDASQCVFGTCGGCTVIGACNYNPTLTIDDGSCDWCECLEEVSSTGNQSEEPYSLFIESNPAVQQGLTTYRIYVNMVNATDHMSAVYGDAGTPLVVNVPEGAYNFIYAGVQASDSSPAFFSIWPEAADDSWLTIGSEPGGASCYTIDNAENSLGTFFTVDQSIVLDLSDAIGGGWFAYQGDENPLPDENMRVLILQITTAGGISGTLNYQVFPNLSSGEIIDLRRTNSFEAYPNAGVQGCTDLEAVNYCAEADFDDGSCFYVYVGCMDEEACNYSEVATTDEGAECVYIEEGECDCDGNVIDECGICGGDGISEGTCDCEGNVLDECGVCGGEGIPEGQCDCEGNILDECGVCGGEGIPEGDCDCDGNVLDECGECGGPGIAEGTCDCDGNMLDALGVCGGDCLIDQNNNGICDIDELGVGSCGPESCGTGTVWDPETQACIVAYPADTNFDGCVQLNDLLDLLASYGLCQTTALSCGDPMTYQGYDYATVLIGEQCWFAENLRSENYENGDAIPSGLSDIEWSSATSGARAVFGDGISGCFEYSPPGDACDELWSLNEYGRLYNWFAVDDVRGLCPSGWHVPTDNEWTVLTDFLGGESVAGTQMKATYGWANPGGNGTNSSGFSGLPGGQRNPNGYFNIAGIAGIWWSATHDANAPWRRDLYSNDEFVSRFYGALTDGLSVRCIKDSE